MSGLGGSRSALGSTRGALGSAQGRLGDVRCTSGDARGALGGAREALPDLPWVPFGMYFNVKLVPKIFVKLHLKFDAVLRCILGAPDGFRARKARFY